MRIGIGYDSHRFAPDRPLVLGGVQVPHARGLAGHSDADVVTHAVIDAVLGAAGLGDIGTHFPPSEPRWKDADSIDLLGRTAQRLRDAGHGVVNVDVTVVCEAPRLAPYVADMRSRIAAALGVEPARVSIKGKSNEGMGWVGRGEGIAALAAALIDAAAEA